MYPNYVRYILKSQSLFNSNSKIKFFDYYPPCSSDVDISAAVITD